MSDDRTAPLAMDLIVRSQRALAEGLEPGGASDRQTVERLLCILDGPEAEQLAALAEAEGVDAARAEDLRPEDYDCGDDEG